MEWLLERRKQSQLGQILVRKKLVSEEQLAHAIAEQKRTGQRLGEILAAAKLITGRQIDAAMRKQRNVRLAASVAGALLAPLHAYAAVAAAPVTLSVSVKRTDQRPPAGALVRLSDAELGAVAGQGGGDDALRERVAQVEAYLARPGLPIDALAGARPAPGNDGARVLAELSTLFSPVFMLLGGQVSVSNVVYDAANASALVHADGSVTLRLPSTIGNISFKNIRVGAAASGPSFGSLELKDIDLRGTTITITRR